MIDDCWHRLEKIETLRFTSSSRASKKTGWTGIGEGMVLVDRKENDTLLFKESGRWKNPEGRSFSFSNTFRWTNLGGNIRLEHLRFGEASPVFLFDLVFDANRRFVSDTPHVCSEDLYTAVLELGQYIQLEWSVEGPELSEHICYEYR